MKKKKWGRFLRPIFGRTMFVVASLLIQLAVLFLAFRWLSNHVFFLYGGFTLFGAVIVIYIINKRQNPSYQLAWIIPVLVFPVFGALFYVFLEMQPGTKIIAAKLRKLTEETKPYLKQDEQVMARLSSVSRGNAHLAHYMTRYGGFPVYEHTTAEYYPLGDHMFPRLLEELRKAKHYIFMEYFILEKGEMWDGILAVLKEKVKEGVEVRVMYDGMCSLTLLPYGYPKELRKMGIQCKMFSPVRPALSSVQNNRDHRKITVIDGVTAFTGGVNIADEYINRRERFGHWKDTAIMVRGDAAVSFLMMFLQMWNVTEQRPEDYERYLRRPEDGIVQTGSDGIVQTGSDGIGRIASDGNGRIGSDGFVMPYGDSPLDDETVGQHVYMDILNEARYYVHIMTPYLILDSDMITALTFAAKRGVETIIIMPHIPDKVYAYLLARSYYAELLSAGVRIYEYTPGFVHAKVFTSDDEKAVVGSINLDYRSLHLHYECAVYLYRSQAVRQVELDFQQTLEQCRPITLEDCRRYPMRKKLAGKVLRLFAPLM